MKKIVDKLYYTHRLTKDEFVFLLESQNPKISQYLFDKADSVRRKYYDNKIYIRGLIEISSYCKNNCYYCGIRCKNSQAKRYRLNKQQILQCCGIGYQLGYRTFVLQGGEDPYYTDKILVDIVATIRKTYPDCAITLSLGERSKQSYEILKRAGANRYLLRFETSDPQHYSKLHPKNLTLEDRLTCIKHLSDIGYTVGTGFMIGSPYQTYSNIADDLLLLKSLNPQMVGIGPFIPHNQSKFADFPSGTVNDTLFVLGLIRLMLPRVLLPSTTALATISSDARKKSLKVGCNVIMPNLSPQQVRKQYLLYDNKAFDGQEASENTAALARIVSEIGYEIVVDRGDYKKS